MNRIRTATAALLVASFVVLQPVAASANDHQRRDRAEDQWDRRDERRDRAEDQWERREERRDRREARRDRREREEDRDRDYGWNAGYREERERDYGWNAGYGTWDAAPHYRRDDRRYRPRRMSRQDRIYRGSDDRYYCRRDDGTTGMIVGGIAGGVLGNIIARDRSKTLGTIIGASAGAMIGRSIDDGNIVCR